MRRSRVIVVEGRDPKTMVMRGLSELDARPLRERIVIKPNLIANRPYPTNTSARTVEAIIDFCEKSKKEIVIAEGAGWCHTPDAFRDRGYVEIAEKHDVRLVDLNRDRFVTKRNPHAIVLKEFDFPLTLENSYLISAAVLKAHSITKVTLSLKNMLGATVGGNKGRFHRLGINESIIDINLYKKPDLAIIDGRKGNVDSELGRRVKEFSLMIFSEDPVAADAVGATKLGYDPLTVRHLVLAQEKGLGTADLENMEIVELGEK